MLTYATVQDFKDMKDLDKSGIIVASLNGDTKIDRYLMRATRFIQRMTRRDFFPWIETREYPIPYAIFDLSLRQFRDAHLQLDQDLLETFEVTNGNQTLESSGYYLLEHNIYPKHIMALKHPNFWGGSTGGVSLTRRYDQQAISINGMWGYQDLRYPNDAWIDTYDVVEAGGIDASVTTLNVTSVENTDAWGEQSFLVGRMLRIENELIEITAIDEVANTVTVRRGVRGSTAVEHDENTVIKRWRVIEDILEATLQVAKTWREADIAAGGRLGVSDVSTGVEIGIPEDPLTTIKMYSRSMLHG